MINPQAMSPGSTMPIYEHLKFDKLNYKAIPERVRAARFLGAKYDFDDAASAEIAQKQAMEVAGVLVEQGGPANMADTKIIALIAYIQRLGVDITRPDTPPAPTIPAGQVAPDAAGSTAETAPGAPPTANVTEAVGTNTSTAPEVVTQ